MPSKRPRASFEPLPPDLDVKQLVEDTPHFQYVDRISCDMIDQQGLANFDRLVLLHVIIGGKPLVIDGYQAYLDPWTFSSRWLQDNHGDKVENARELTKGAPLPLTLGHYLRNMGKLADQFSESPDNYKDTKERQRIYLKDIDCPPVWQDKLKDQLPPNVFYLNESTGDLGGPGSVDENAPTGGKRQGRGIAPAGDLMSSLPPPMRAENLMCYVGHEGTYTPAHREMCASLGHNIMVEASDVLGQDGKPERPGSSIWFMTESKDRKTVQEYWLSILGHDIEVENHFAQIAAWKQAPFSVYVVEQRPGDFILIPPLAPHQVWNRGTRTMKVAWNRTTVETLEMAVQEALPNARMVCRDEQYKNKAIIYFTLQKYSSLIARVRDQQQTAASPQEAAVLRQSPRIRQLQKDFKRLFRLYRDILLSEMFSPDTPHEKNVQFVPFEGYVTCAYCRGNIFNRFLTCNTCEYALGTTEPEPYDVCLDCYAMGRSCGCISKLRWVEQFKWKELTLKYEQWRRQYVDLEGAQKADLPLPLPEERLRRVTKTLAQVCQEQLKRRPWVDINKSREPDSADEESSEEIQYNADGTIQSHKKKRRTDAWLKNHRACHVCCHRHETWKMASCECGRYWCYGTLFRGFDTMPLAVMEDPSWKCPHCREVCFAGNCRKDARQKPYQPNGTLLGHDTRKVADVRSVESLVDFGVSNLNFLKETVEAPRNNVRLWQRQQEANKDKEGDPSLDDRFYEAPTDRMAGSNQIEYDYDTSTIDPRLAGSAPIDPQIDAAESPISVRNGNGEIPSVAALLQGVPPSSGEDLHGEYAGYQPAAQQGYVAPHAVMFQTPSADDIEHNETYPDIDEPDSAAGSKRRRADDMNEIKRLPSKKKKRVEEEPSNEATKQFRKEQEKKAREIAKKNGVYIRFIAALRGHSRIVRLRIGRANARRIHIREVADHRNATAQDEEIAEDSQTHNFLLQSDIAVPEPTFAGAPKPKSAKQTKNVRVRVERDDDFGTRKRKVTENKSTTSKTKSKGQPDFEEVEVETDPENDPEAESQITGAVETTSGGGRRRRISAWQARRHEDSEEEELEELPDDWKDGRVRNRERPSGSTRKNVAGKSPRSAQIRPLHNATDGANDEDSDDSDEEIERRGTNGGGNAQRIADAALLQAEENRRAKLEAARLADEENDSRKTPAKSKNGTARPVGNHPVAGKSIMFSKGPGGRSIKIVSAAAKRKSSGVLSGAKTS